MDILRIGLVSVSDRASGGVYQDKGIPALEEWLSGALATPFKLETRLIPDEQTQIEQTLCELVASASKCVRSAYTMCQRQFFLARWARSANRR